jgi:hypothetical protein
MQAGVTPGRGCVSCSATRSWCAAGAASAPTPLALELRPALPLRHIDIRVVLGERGMGIRMAEAMLRRPMQLLWHERTHADAGSRYFRELILDAAGAHRRPGGGRGRRVPVPAQMLTRRPNPTCTVGARTPGKSTGSSSGVPGSSGSRKGSSAKRNSPPRVP